MKAKISVAFVLLSGMLTAGASRFDPPVSSVVLEDSDHTLWVSGDDRIELYLRTGDPDMANAVIIADVGLWNSYLAWNEYPKQQSAPVTLVDGQKYYIEVAMKV